VETGRHVHKLLVDEAVARSGPRVYAFCLKSVMENPWQILSPNTQMKSLKNFALNARKAGRKSFPPPLVLFVVNVAALVRLRILAVERLTQTVEVGIERHERRALKKGSSAGLV